MKRVLVLLFIGVLSLSSLLSCSKDDDKVVVKTYYEANSYSFDYNDASFDDFMYDTKEELVVNEKYWTMILNDDKTFGMKFEEGERANIGKWSITGNKLIITFTENPEATQEFTLEGDNLLYHFDELLLGKGVGEHIFKKQ